MRLGIGSYTFAWGIGVPGCPSPPTPMTPYELLDRAVRCGVGVVQIADNLPLEKLSASELAAFLNEARLRGIALEAGTSGIVANNLRSALELASQMRSPLLRVLPDTPRHQPTADEVVAVLQDVLPDFERADVILAIENHTRFTPAILLDIIRRAKSDYLGICFDTANSIGCLESADRVLDVLGDCVVNAHVKDYSIFRSPHGKGFIVEGRPAGQGQLNIPALIDRLKGLGRELNVILELWPPPQATLQETIEMEQRWADESIAYLRNLITEPTQ